VVHSKVIIAKPRLSKEPGRVARFIY